MSGTVEVDNDSPVAIPLDETPRDKTSSNETRRMKGAVEDVSDNIVAIKLDEAPSDKGKKKDATDKPKKLVPIRKMFRFATCVDYLMIVVCIVCSVANGASLAGFSILLGQIFDVLNSPDSGAASDVALIFIYIGLGLFVVCALQAGLSTVVAERLTIKLRTRYLDALLAQDISFFDRQDSGTLASRVAENGIMYREALGEKFAQIFQFSGLFVGGIVVGFTYLWQLCLVILAMSPLLGLSGLYMAKVMNTIVTGQLESYASAGAVAEETFSLIRTVTSFGLHHTRINAYEKELDIAAKKTTKQGFAMGIGFGSAMCFMFCSYAVSFWVGSILIVNSKSHAVIDHPLDPGSAEPFCQVGALVPQICSPQVKNGTVFETEADVCGCSFCKCGCYFTTAPNATFESSCISGGDVLLTFFSVLIGSFAIGQASPALGAFSKGRSAAADLYAVIDTKPKIDATSEEGERPENIQGEIVFKDVEFTYPSRPDAPVFKKLNLCIPKGKRVALVGESGSGKSTCVGLIERYYDPQAGSITLDGIDIKRINVKYLRSLIGLVSQEPILFGTTVRENIRFGRPDATDAEIEKACMDANAHSFISSWSDGYDTFVTSSLVSGGQKQRLAIARALLRNPPILLLDEATAALDNESERLVNEAIDRLLSEVGSRTTIVIAHRLTSIRACEKIIVLDKGKMAEEGSHDELMAMSGLYSSLFKISEGAANKRIEAEAAASPKTDRKLLNNDVENSSFSLEPQNGDENQITMSIKETDGDANPGEKAPGKPFEKSYPVRKAFIYAYPERFYFIPALLAAIVNGLVFPVFVLLFSNVLDTLFFVNSSAILSGAMVWCLYFFGLALMAGLALFFQNVCFQFINGRMTKRVRLSVFKHIISQEIGFFDQKENNVGSLTSKLAQDAAMVRAAISDRVEVAAMNTSTLIAGFVIAFVASWQVALVVFAMFPAIAIAGAIQFMVMSGIATTDQKALEQSAHTLSESIMGVRTVAAFNMQPSIKKLYNQQLMGPLRLAMRKGALAGLGFGFSQAVVFFAYALTFWYGSKLVTEGTISFKDLNQALFGILMTATALGQNMALAPDISKGSAAVNSIFRMLDRKTLIDPFSEVGQKPSTLIGDISFENIQFAYPTRPDITVLKKFNLQVKRGQTVAFVGSSGSGKSTLVLLLERFYDPLQGTVKIDDIDVRDLNVAWLRNQIGIVSQEPALFKGSIMENIRAGNPSATDDEVIEAAKMANAHDFIMKFDEGYNTNLQVASGVSGGQKQRIAIARALVRNPRILLLDEATSALDEESQKLVQGALDKLLQKSTRTTIVVAHRLSTIRNADTIVVLQNGIVVEQGSYQELSAKPNGAFISLLRAQAKVHGE